MPLWFKHKQQEPGKVIEAQTLRQMANTCDWVTRMWVSPPLSGVMTGAGPLVRLGGMVFNFYFGIVTTTITAMSGLTPGMGKFTPYRWSGTAYVATAGITPMAVYSILPYALASGSTSYIFAIEMSSTLWVVATGGSSSAAWGLCQLSSTLAAATGTWPSITPQTQSSISIYEPASGSLSLISSSSVIYNWRNVSWAAAKTSYVTKGLDGTWSIVDQDC